MIEALETPERGMALANRDAKSSKAKKSDKNGESSAREELELLKARVSAVKASPPKDKAPHCGACFRRGWEATIGALEDE